MPLEPLDQIVLHWLGYESDPDHIYLGFFTDHLEEPGSVGYQDLRKDCYLAGVPLPSTKEFLNRLQALIEQGYAGAEVDEEEPVEDVRHLPDGIEPWDVSVYTTLEGLQQNEPIEEKIEQEEEAGTGEFVRQYLNEVCLRLPFRAVIPEFILADAKLLAGLEVVSGENALRLRCELGVATITIMTFDQSAGQLPDLERTGELQAEKFDNFGTVGVTIHEYQVGVNCARIEAQWLQDEVSVRIALEKEYIFDDYDEEPKALAIDTAMRRRILKLVRSCLRTDRPQLRVSTK